MVTGWGRCTLAFMTTERIARQVAEAGALELDARKPRILAIGSQLTYGSVGLNAAERVYADEGMSAIRVPSVVLSVMPHYPSVHHVDIDAGWIGATLTDLDAIGATDSIELVSAGYLVSVAQAEALAQWLKREPQNETPRPVFVLDPTLGDVEVGFYTDPALAGGFLEHLVPLASGMTPNLFELAHLAGVPLESLNSLEAVEQAARGLMGEHTEWVIVTGIDPVIHGDRGPATSPGVASASGTPRQGGIGELVVTRDGVRIRVHEKIDTAAKGLGDTFTARLNVALLRGEHLDAAIDLAAAEVRRRAS